MRTKRIILAEPEMLSDESTENIKPINVIDARSTKVKALQKALLLGEQSGKPEKFDSESFLKELHAKYS